MSRALEATSQSPPPPVLELVLSEQRDVVLLNDDTVMDAYSIPFDEF